MARLEPGEFEALVRFVRAHTMQHITDEHDDAAALSWFVKQDQDLYDQLALVIPTSSLYHTVLDSASHYVLPMTYFLASAYMMLPQEAL